ncbi:MAG: superoxide dismutase [Candidatus Gracilibacteria bacterium]|jgi:Fe-Mn family superoxide dismutase|nr:superoxide dismutase [Candidatus Gracilibacteria bacterium]
MAYTLKPIGYEFTALEPLMDAKTVELHHTKHHQAYVNNLNAACEKHPELFEKSILELIQNLNEVPEDIRTAVRNNGGGTLNHDLFWEIVTPGGATTPSEGLLAMINKDFGSFENMKNTLLDAANKHFASGWAFLYKSKDGTLKIKSMPGHDTPLMDGETPLITIDVWEHAYYLKYQNLRADFTKNFFSLLNWDKIEEKLKN